MKANVYTRLISQYLEVTTDKALEVQNFIDNYLDLDWSEAGRKEIEATAFYAYSILRRQETSA